jgi:uncharacterized protein with HEPN domain
MTSVKSKLKFALDSGDAKTDRVKFGNQKGLRDVVTINGKHFTYNPKTITKVLTNRLTKLLKHNKNINWQQIFVRYTSNTD